MSGQGVPVKVAAYAVAIAEALEGLQSRDCGYGEFYITGVSIAYDGEDCGISINPDEFGGLEIRVTGNPR